MSSSVAFVAASERDFAELKELLNDWRVHEVLVKAREWYDAEQKRLLEAQFTSTQAVEA